MKQRVARFLAPVTLLEWGGILTYFYLSHRLTAFLHPNFRPLVLVTGILLLLTAVCVLFDSGKDGAALAHDCDAAGCESSHAKLTTGGMLAFLVLLLPIALAARISPDGDGAVLIQNRGAAESLANAPGVLAAAARTSPTSAYVGVQGSKERSSTSSKDQPSDIPGAWSPPNAPDYSASPSKNISEDDYPSSEALAAKLRADSDVSMAAAQKLPKTASTMNAPLKALNERPGAETPLGKLEDVLKMADSPLHEAGVDALKSAEDEASVSIAVVDLLVAAQNPTLMHDLRGKRVELIGQVIKGDDSNFRLLRLLVLCCAADAQPLAVRVESKSKTNFEQMAWMKVIGKVKFIRKGSESIPVITADEVTAINQPDEPYLY